jgi:peptidoglycan hydrolase FlgJ
MEITQAQKEFIKKYWWNAVKAAQRYAHNPTYMLAQSVAERGWTGSTLSNPPYNNFFGVTAGGNTDINDFEYWKGATKKSTASGLLFRVYPNLQASFYDHAKLLSQNLYKSVVKQGTPEQFAHSIAYSRYISEVNGDNRDAYKRNILRNIEIIKEIPKPISLSAKLFIGVSVVGAAVWFAKETSVIKF